MCDSISLRNTIIIEEEVMDLEGVGGTWEELEREEGGENDTKTAYSCAKAQ